MDKTLRFTFWFTLSGLGVDCVCIVWLCSRTVAFQAVQKGLSTTMVGAIIGIFELVVVMLSPIYGRYVRIAFIKTFIVVLMSYFSALISARYLNVSWSKLRIINLTRSRIFSSNMGAPICAAALMMSHHGDDVYMALEPIAAKF